MPSNAADYEEDFYAWTVEQGRLLRSGEPLLARIEELIDQVFLDSIVVTEHISDKTV